MEEKSNTDKKGIQTKDKDIPTWTIEGMPISDIDSTYLLRYLNRGTLTTKPDFYFAIINEISDSLPGQIAKFWDKNNQEPFSHEEMSVLDTISWELCTGDGLSASVNSSSVYIKEDEILVVNYPIVSKNSSASFTSVMEAVKFILKNSE